MYISHTLLYQLTVSHTSMQYFLVCTSMCHYSTNLDFKESRPKCRPLVCQLEELDLGLLDWHTSILLVITSYLLSNKTTMTNNKVKHKNHTIAIIKHFISRLVSWSVDQGSVNRHRSVGGQSVGQLGTSRSGVGRAGVSRGLVD